jgi:hypothetical protein
MINALIGGIFIGIAVSMMLLFNGRVTGISGIISGTLKPVKGDFLWRLFFLLGLAAGGLVLAKIYPEAFVQKSSALKIDYIIAGLLVGFGTLLGNGCTSGHGVCGISRFSVRSMLSTVTFIAFGALSVIIFRFLRGEL